MHQIILKSGVILDIGVQATIDKVVNNMKDSKDTLIENKNGNTIFFIAHTDISAIQYHRK